MSSQKHNIQCESNPIKDNYLCGCQILSGTVFRDHRGMFAKTYTKKLLTKMGLDAEFVESYYTVSTARVLRGMHFQMPPSDHAKLVYCLSGAIMDVALDLRIDSPTFRKHQVVTLVEESGLGLYLPKGIAHGFYVINAPAIVMYYVTSEYNTQLDAGIAWDSFGMLWPEKYPIISKRDAEFPNLDSFTSPFKIANK